NLVSTAEDERHTKSVNYDGLIAPLIKANQDLRKENVALRAELNSQRADIDMLIADVRGLKAHTNYGMSKATMGFVGFIFFLIFGAVSYVIFYKPPEEEPEES